MTRVNETGAGRHERMPSLLHSALNLATSVFMEALPIQYGSAAMMSNLEMRSISTTPVERAMTFFVLTFLIEAKKLDSTIFPTTCTTKECTMFVVVQLESHR